MSLHSKNTPSKRSQYGLSQWLCAILVILSTTTSSRTTTTLAIEEIPLPHIDIFMLCSNDIETAASNGSFDYVRELDGYFTDLLPSAVDVTITGGNQEFVACAATGGNSTQVTIASDGVAEFDSNNPFTANDIQSLVTHESLLSYFANVCNELDTFEAIISEAGSEPKVGVEAALTHFVCDAESAEVLARSVQTAAIVVIIMSIIFVLCILACVCVCCGFCS